MLVHMQQNIMKHASHEDSTHLAEDASAISAMMGPTPNVKGPLAEHAVPTDIIRQPWLLCVARVSRIQ